MPTEKVLDYVQASCSVSEYDLIDNKARKISPLPYYKRGYQDANETRYYFGNPNSKKALLVLSGQSLDALRNGGYSDQQILQSLVLKDASFTRIDHAITVHSEDYIFSLGDIQNAYSDGLIKSPLCERGGKLISTMELDGKIYPETFYIGDLKKRGKKGLFRAYDKGAQLDITREVLMRIELEERGENANNSAKRIANGATVSQVFKSRFDIETEKFQQIFDCDSVPIERGKGKEKTMTEDERKWKWLIETVAPTLARAIALEPVDVTESENFSRFCAAAGISEKIHQLALHLYGSGDRMKSTK